MEKKILFSILLATVVLICGFWIYVSYDIQIPNSGFTIYLCEDNTIVILDKDVLSYNRSNHEMRLSVESAIRLERMKEKLHGRFMIRINGEDVYGGVILPPTISRSYPCSEVIIVIPSLLESCRNVKLQMGYPECQPLDNDPRYNLRIFEYFGTEGKLIQSP
jgi:hypothetical protein